jgi:hypothetical protein
MSALATAWNTAKFLRLRRRQQDAAAALRDASARARTTRDEVLRCEGLEREQRQRPRTGPVPSPELASDLQRARSREREARDHHDRLVREVEPLNLLLPRLEEFLRAHGIDPDTVESADLETPTPPGPPPTLKELDVVRRRIEARKAERGAIARAPASEQEIRENARARVQQLRGAARLPGASTLALRGGGTSRGALLGTGHGIGTLDHLVAANEALLARLLPEAVEALLVADALAEAQARGGHGLPVAQRKARLDALDTAILQDETEEEGLVERFEFARAAVERRPDADPRAVLGWLKVG